MVFLFFSGSDSLGEKFPKAHGVLHAADPSHCLEHSNRKCCLISFPKNPKDPLPEVEGLSLGLTVMCLVLRGVCVLSVGVLALPCRLHVQQTLGSLPLLYIKLM